MSIASDLIADFAREDVYTKKVLAAVPAASFSWKPHEKSWSLAQLAGHIAENPAWLDSMFGEEMDFAQMTDYVPYVPETKEQLVETYTKNAAAFGEQLKDKSDDFLRAEWTMRMGEKVILKEPRAAVIREIMIHHAVHHRGQLTVYLRLLDVPVPGTYGGSADEPFA